MFVLGLATRAIIIDVLGFEFIINSSSMLIWISVFISPGPSAFKPVYKVGNSTNIPNFFNDITKSFVKRVRKS